MFFNRIIRRNKAVGKVAKTCWVRQNQVNREFAFNKTYVNKRITWAPSKSFQTSKYNLKRYTTNNTQRAIAAQERTADAQKRLGDALERIADAQEKEVINGMNAQERFADAQERIADAQEKEVINGMNIKTSIDDHSDHLGWMLVMVCLNIGVGSVAIIAALWE